MRASVKYESAPCEPIQCSLGASNVSPFGADRVRTSRHTRGHYHRGWTEAGTSLIELMFAVAAGLVVIGATLHALSYFQKQFMKQQRGVAQQQDLRLGLEVLEQELRLAGSDSLTTAAPE